MARPAVLREDTVLRAWLALQAPLQLVPGATPVVYPVPVQRIHARLALALAWGWLVLVVRTLCLDPIPTVMAFRAWLAHSILGIEHATLAHTF